MFKITIDTENEAFSDSNYPLEIARILKEIARDLEDDRSKYSYQDVNGNTVCKIDER